MKYKTSGNIHRLFIKEDAGTIVTRNNVRRLCLQNNIKHLMTANIILIDEQDFIDKMNPYKVTEHIYKVPRLRNIDGCVREWNKQRSKGERYIHADEISAFLKKDCTVFKYKFGNRWIINYDQLEPYLKEISKAPSEKWEQVLAYWRKKNQSNSDEND